MHPGDFDPTDTDLLKSYVASRRSNRKMAELIEGMNELHEQIYDLAEERNFEDEPSDQEMKLVKKARRMRKEVNETGWEHMRISDAHQEAMLQAHNTKLRAAGVDVPEPSEPIDIDDANKQAMAEVDANNQKMQVERQNHLDKLDEENKRNRLTPVIVDPPHPDEYLIDAGELAIEDSAIPEDHPLRVQEKPKMAREIKRKE